MEDKQVLFRLCILYSVEKYINDNGGNYSLGDFQIGSYNDDLVIEYWNEANIGLATPSIDDIYNNVSLAELENRHDAESLQYILENIIRNVPSLTTTERNDIIFPKDGMMLYNTTTNAYNVRDSGVWRSIDSGLL